MSSDRVKCLQRVVLAVGVGMLASALVAGASAGAEDRGRPPAGHPPAAIPGPSPVPKTDADLTGKDIYRRVLENRFDSYIQSSSLVSGDRGGNTQETRLNMTFRSFRDENDEPSDGSTLSKAIVYYTYPFDIRHSGYLVINNLDRPNDQFVYRPSSRKVRRVNLRGEAVFGTDFSFEDVIPRELEDADYARKADEIVDGAPVFVVEAIPRPETDSEYSRLLIYVEKERSVPLRTRYWDDRGVEIKQLQVERPRIERIANVWVPMRATMRHLRLDSFTVLDIAELTPNPALSRTTFDLRRLEGH